MAQQHECSAIKGKH